MGLVGPENLKRRDRTRGDCGYYITHENGWLTIHEFASKEECQTFVASLTNAAAEARAEQAAASLLSELEIDSSVDAISEKGKHRKGKKKGRR